MSKALGITCLILGAAWGVTITYWMVVPGIGISVRRVGNSDGLNLFIATAILFLIMFGWVVPLASGAWLLWRSR
jgi:hypothetical protein